MIIIKNNSTLFSTKIAFGRTKLKSDITLTSPSPPVKVDSPNFNKGLHCIASKLKVAKKLLGANMVQKGVNEEEIKAKDGKYRICTPVYMVVNSRANAVFTIFTLI